MKEYGDEVIKVWDTLADVGEITWEFLGDPANTLEDLWDKWTDDKWTYRLGSNDNDVMHTDSKWENVKTYAGDDLVISYNGWNVLLGGDGNDILYGGDGTLTENYLRPDEIYGGPGNDYINGREQNDVLVGNSGHDFVVGGPGDDEMYALKICKKKILYFHLPLQFHQHRHKQPPILIMALTFPIFLKRKLHPRTTLHHQ